MNQRTLFDGETKNHPEPAPVPYAADSETSKAAAEGVRRRAAGLRQAVYAFIMARGERGATDEEIYDELGTDRRDSLRPRRNELMNSGFIRDSGETRPTHSGADATVWVATGKAPNDEKREERPNLAPWLPCDGAGR
jgi:hypothetical protein